MKAAADPTRLRLLNLCAEGELTVTELTHILRHSQPRVSRHLKVLVDSGLLERHPEGAWVFYRLPDSGSNADLAKSVVRRLPKHDPQLQQDRLKLGEIKQNRRIQATDYFDSIAQEWDEVRRLYASEIEIEKRVRGLIKSANVDLLLDIGTGTSRLLTICLCRCNKTGYWPRSVASNASGCAQ